MHHGPGRRARGDFRGDEAGVKGNTMRLSSSHGVSRDNWMPEASTTHNGNDRPASAPYDILVVDDTISMANILVMFLELEGFTARAVENGALALELLEGGMPRMAFIDLSMPVMDGLELARRIREREDGRDICLIALTGWDDEAHRNEATAAGFDDYLVKAVSPATLREVLARVSQEV